MIQVNAAMLIKGVVANIIEGPVNAEVQIKLPNGECITAIVTLESVRKLRLTIGQKAFPTARLTELKHGA